MSMKALLDGLDATLDARGVDQADIAHVQQAVMAGLSHVAQYVPVGYIPLVVASVI